MTVVNIPRPPSAPPPLVAINPTSWEGVPVPERRWIIKDWIPEGYVTALYGDGGLGKSIVIQQLVTCRAVTRPWFGLETQPGRSLYVNCEEKEDELHRRQADINRLYGCGFKDLEAMRLLPRLGFDNILMHFANGRAELTDFAYQLIAMAKADARDLLGLDTLNDIFGGNENDRGQVRQMVQACLGHIAREINGTVVVVAHPSRLGLSSGEGDSGSTGWSNAFRSRLSFEAAKQDKSDKSAPLPDPDVRFLSRRKGNYARRSLDTITVRWNAGAFATDTDSINRPPVENVFLELLDRLTSEGQPVSPNNRASNFAPKVFVQTPGNHGYRVVDFEQAMRALLVQGEIKPVSYGRADRTNTRLERRDLDIPW
jgi:RecA-family ATPase